MLTDEVKKYWTTELTEETRIDNQLCDVGLDEEFDPSQLHSFEMNNFVVYMTANMVFFFDPFANKIVKVIYHYYITDFKISKVVPNCFVIDGYYGVILVNTYTLDTEEYTSR